MSKRLNSRIMNTLHQPIRIFGSSASSLKLSLQFFGNYHDTLF